MALFTKKWLLYTKSSCCLYASSTTTSKHKRNLTGSSGKTQLNSGIKNFLETKECLRIVAKFIPSRFLKLKIEPPSYCFVVDDEVAETIFESIKSDIDDSCTVLEANPGLGLVTRYLIKNTRSRVFVFDSMCNILPPVLQLIQDNPSRINIVPTDFFEIHRCIAQDKMDGGSRFVSIFKDFQFQDWKAKPVTKVFGVLTSRVFLPRLIQFTVFRDAIIKLGRLEYYLVIPEKTIKSLTTTPRRIRSHTLFNTMFDMEVRLTLPRTSFLPWEQSKGETKNENNMHLVKITPKADIYDKFSEQELQLLWHFLNGVGYRRKSKVVAYFEQWVPNSGLKLIEEGLSPMIETADLPANDLLQLFRVFVSLPGLNKINYLNIHESSLLIEQNETLEGSKKQNK